MNYIDIVIAVFFIYGVFKGFLNGIIKEITGIISLIGGVYIAINFSEYLKPIIKQKISTSEDFLPILVFAIVFFVSFLFLRFFGYFIDKIVNTLSLGLVTKFIGGVFGGVKIIIIFCFIFFMIEEYKIINKKTLQESQLLIPIQHTTKIIIPKINKHQEDIVKQVQKETKKTKEKLEKIRNQEP